MQDLNVEAEAVIAALRRRVDELSYENVLLSLAVDQLQQQLGAPIRKNAG
ncbi:hypothetical protein [Nonomuraea endophytica]|uniref:Regulator of replication initiation timing n=1 Tax=Nonomuraea endophytica TaxID=714136 RepID=A0A7W8EJC5_9ACTN|nr:hypothetical protein [Nonomuraea endophytica]MBB5081386.1 regulator of replication initiation timing [Nonomuraea endophytica]